MVRSRLLRVLVDAVVIEDGQVAPPAVGEVLELAVSFREVPAGGGDASVVTLRAGAESLRDGAPSIGSSRLGGSGDRGPAWPTLLRGDGWTASWSSPRPVTGQVQVTGRLLGDFGPVASGRVRGRVTRAWVVSELTIAEHGEDGTRLQFVPGKQRLRDVEVAPDRFEHWSPAQGSPAMTEPGVLVDLDLDDVPPLPLRPSFVPGALSAHGPDLWVADEALPTVVRLRDRSDVAVYSWAGHIGSDNEVFADRAGCWVTGRSGVVRCDHDGTARLVDERRCHQAAAADGVLAVIGPLTASPAPDDHVVLRVYGPPGTDAVQVIDGPQITSITSAGDDFLVGRLDYSQTGKERNRFDRLHPDGRLNIGPWLDERRYRLRRLMGSQPPILNITKAVRHLRPDLSLGQPQRVPHLLLAGWAANGRAFVLTHHHDGRRADSWPSATSWTSGSLLLHELDLGTLQPLSTISVPGVPTGLTIDGQETIWISCNGLHALSEGEPRYQPVELNIE